MSAMKLMKRIDHSFASVKLPPNDKITESHLPLDDYGGQLAAIVEDWRNREPDTNLLRELHQELRKLSPDTTRWIIPHYLRYALSDEAKYTRMEIAFFVLSLISRSDDDTRQIKKRFSSMSVEQIQCILEVLEYLRADFDWGEYMGEEVEAAISTLKVLIRG